jgi:DNA (cytosine-5)-methyltransferase 1
MKNGDITAIDFFCGAGGLTYGLRKAGINVIKGIDIDESAKDTYEKNNPGSKFISKDVRKLDTQTLLENVDRSKSLLLFAACAPCQPFSTQNKKRKEGNDPRRSLIEHFAELVDKILPDYIIVENVRGFGKNSNIHRNKLISVLNKNGYKYSEDVIRSEDYGVPQTRHRYVIVASIKGKISLPKPVYGPERRLPYKTVRDTISKYPQIEAGTGINLIPNHKSRRLLDVNLKRIRLVPKNGGSRNSLPARLQLKCHKEYKGHSDVYGRMRWDRPSPTLTCKCNSISNGRFGHPEQDRAISLREAAALQTFPDHYVFVGNDTDIARHIGNAVPVLLSTKLGKIFVRNALSFSFHKSS